MVRMLEDPDSQRAAGRIKFSGSFEDCHEHRLHDVFGFSSVAQDLHGDANHQPLIAVKDHGQRVVVASRKMRHHGFV